MPHACCTGTRVTRHYCLPLPEKAVPQSDVPAGALYQPGQVGHRDLPHVTVVDDADLRGHSRD